MRRIRHHDDGDLGLFGDLPARFADDAAGGDKFRRDGTDVVKEQAMPRGLEMAGHRASHGAQADEADIDHCDVSCPIR
jgi:hypothetical protein